MGYYANGGGYIRLDPLHLPVPQDKLKDWVAEQFDEAGPSGEVCFGQDPTLVDVDLWEKYSDVCWWDFLVRLEPYTRDGEIEAHGEDGCHWRFIFKDKKFIEQNGRVVYDDV